MQIPDKTFGVTAWIRSPQIKHTDQDLPAWVPEAGLEPVARAFAKIIDKANKLDQSELQPAGRTKTQNGLQ